MDAHENDLWKDAVIEQMAETNELLKTVLTCMQVEGRKTRQILKQE